MRLPNFDYYHLTTNQLIYNCQSFQCYDERWLVEQFAKWDSRDLDYRTRLVYNSHRFCFFNELVNRCQSYDFYSILDAIQLMSNQVKIESKYCVTDYNILVRKDKSPKIILL